ncbi:hypothetical protein PLESTB_001114000 [Pleodorina starrii]|uniref:SnoaL-like domain-containing protein n=1 Tax=Pleodorina starrii TaxID=330485 RepID=A0A9W6BRA4_9CHLO|nr:hypothetical protein PLESTM_001350700 [Pleodorina starrii]GLC56500.1 hypothetical protein PLESTB_001114000 [Pleodorina starrii]GLC65927.1 hypothetical protein PLESTF_000362700 [Pleodorina starrii]
MINAASTSVKIADKPRIRLAWAVDWRYARPGAGHRGVFRTLAAASKLQRASNGIKVNQQQRNAASPRTLDSPSRADAKVGLRRLPDAPGPGVGKPPVVANAQSAARSLFAALNQRDVSAVLSLLADDVQYENLGSSTVLRGRAAVGRFYLEALAALPEDAVFVLEGPGGPSTDPWVDDEAAGAGGPILQAGMAWRVELDGRVVPLSRGVGVYWADPRTGRLARIWDNPEHTVKQATPSLTSAAWDSPLLRGLGLAPVVMPAAVTVGSFLNNLGPGGGEAAVGGMAPTGNGGGGGGGLAGSVLSTLNRVMAFQSQGSVASGASSNRGSSSSSSGGVGGGGIVPGSGRGAVYRDHTRGQQVNGGGGRAVVAAAASAAAAGGGGGGAGSGVSAAAPKAQPGGGGSRPMRGSGAPASSSANAGGAAAAAAAPAARSGIAAAAGARSTNGAVLTSPTTTTTAVRNGSGGGSAAASGVRATVTAPPAAAAATATVSVVGARDVTALSSSGEAIRMRQLPEPTPTQLAKSTPTPTPTPTPGGASASVASSVASVDGGDNGTATTSSASTTAAATIAAATPALSQSTAAGTEAAAATTTTTTTTTTASAPSSCSSSSSSGRANSVSGGGGGGDSGNGGSGDGGVVSGSVDSGSGSDTDGGSGGGGGGGGPASLPFRPSASSSADLTGLWEKDPAASQVEEYESMLDVLELGGLQKVTARLIDGLDVRQDEQRFEVSFVTVVPFFRVTEKSRFGGLTSMMRRDLRSGRQTAQAEHIPGGVAVDMRWESPLAGSLKEEYVLSEEGAQMAVTSSIRIGARSAVATQVYRRSSRNKNDFLASKRSSYGSLEDVLKSQEKKYGKMK